MKAETRTHFSTHEPTVSTRAFIVLTLIFLAVACAIARAQTIELGSRSDGDYESRDVLAAESFLHGGPDWFVEMFSSESFSFFARTPFFARYTPRAVPTITTSDAISNSGAAVQDPGVRYTPFDLTPLSSGVTSLVQFTVKPRSTSASAVGTAYYWGGSPGANWDVAGNWGPTAGTTGSTAFPNAADDSALNVQAITTSTLQDHSGGVTVGTIAHNPTSAAGASAGETWTITATTPITMQVTSGAAVISNANPDFVHVNNLTIDGTGGLSLNSNLAITNSSQQGGVVTISAPIADGANSHSVAVAGPGTTIFSTANSYSGTTTINSGTLQVAAHGGLGSTSGVTVNAGTLLFSNSSTTDRINDSATISLNGGTINTAGLSEHGASNNTPGMGALTLASNSIIDLANGASIIAFAPSGGQTWAGTLSIYNWTGTPGVGGGTDQLYFGNDASGLNSTQLSQIVFYSDSGTTPLGMGMILSNGEVTPVPEPGTWAAAALALGAVALTQRRRFRRAKP